MSCPSASMTPLQLPVEPVLGERLPLLGVRQRREGHREVVQRHRLVGPVVLPDLVVIRVREEQAALLEFPAAWPRWPAR